MEASALPRRRQIEIPLGKALLSAMGDDALAEHARRGSERAFEVIYDRYHRGLLAFCRHMLGSADEAEDALQQVFASAHAGLLRSRRPIVLKPWLYTIARNRCLSMLRARREQAAEPVELATEGLPDQVERRHELRSLLQDLRELPEEQRAALVLAEVADLSHAEIGDVIGCEANRVKALVFQARSSLIEMRKARETPCAEIREKLATLRGGALRRGELRRHLKVCSGCAEFRDEVRRQRALLALLLPVVPSAGLKRSVLAATGIGSGGAGAGGGGGAVAGLALKGGLAKFAAAGVLGALAVGGGVVLEEHHHGGAGGAAATPPVTTPAHVTARARVVPAIPATPDIVVKRPAAASHTPRHHATPGHRAHHGKGHGTTKSHGHGLGSTVSPVIKSKGHAYGQANVHPAHPVHPSHPTTPATGKTKALPSKPPQAATPVPPAAAPDTLPGKALGRPDQAGG